MYTPYFGRNEIFYFITLRFQRFRRLKSILSKNIYVRKIQSLNLWLLPELPQITKKMTRLFARMFIILLSLLFSVSAFSYEPIEKFNRESEFAKALDFLNSFKNDSANIILVRLIKDLSFTDELNTPFGLHVQLRNAEALERDHQDAIAIEKLLSVVRASKEKKEWEVLANGYLSLARLYEKLDFDEKCLAYLNAAEHIIKENDLDILNSRFYSRLSSYHRLFGSKDSNSRTQSAS